MNVSRRLVEETVIERVSGLLRVRTFIAEIFALYTVGAVAFLFSTGELGGESGVEWLYVFPVITATGVGLFLALRRPENAVGTLISLTGTAQVTLGLLNYLEPRVLDRGTPLVAVLVNLATDTAWIIQFQCILVLLPLWFPTGGPMNNRWGWVGRAGIVLSTIALASFAFAESVCVRYESPESSVCTREVPIPWAIEGIPDLEPLLFAAMAMAIPAVVSVFIRWRRSGGLERQQLKWVLLASTGVVAVFGISFGNLEIPQWVLEASFALSVAGLWVAIAIAVLRYRLYDIDRIISRSVSYVLVIGLLTLVAIVSVALLTLVLPSDDPLVVAITTLLAAALFNPLRLRLRRIVDRRFNRTRFDAVQVTEAFSYSLRDRVDPDDIVSDWVGVVSETMQPASIGVWVR